MFDTFKELNDEDQVLREDVNKLIHILRQKAKKSQISPIIYGIYDDYDCKPQEDVSSVRIFSDYLEQEKKIQD